jgi:hypothetical protein
MQSIERGLGQVRHRACQPSEQDGALLIGYASDGIDKFRGRFFPKITDKKSANLIPAHARESASGGLSGIRMQVIEEIA